MLEPEHLQLELWVLCVEEWGLWFVLVHLVDGQLDGIWDCWRLRRLGSALE